MVSGFSADRKHLIKQHKGLTADTTELFRQIQDPDPVFLEVLLKNPQLSEEHLLVLLKRRDLTSELVDRIYRAFQQSLSHRLLLVLVRNPAISGGLARTLLPRLRLFELVDICLLPGVTPDQKLAAERLILQRLPPLPLGQKITLARRGTPDIVGALVKEGQPRVLEVCLNNPHLREAAIHQFLRGGSATPETISLIARHSRWKERPDLKRAILRHPRTPEIWFTLWLPRMSQPLLKQLLSSMHSQPHKQRLITRELQRRNR